MGYRLYIGKISKEKYNNLKDCTTEEILEKYGLEEEGERPWVSLRDLLDKELHGLGKYVDYKNDILKPFFTKDEVQKELCSEQDFWVTDREFIKLLIEDYSTTVKELYEKMLKPFFTDNRITSKFLNSIKTEYDNDFNPKHSFKWSEITEDEQTAIFNMFEHIRDMGNEHGVKSYFDMKPYNLEKGKEVTTSWKFEYAIFELVRLYKEFDNDTDVLVYYGW